MMSKTKSFLLVTVLSLFFTCIIFTGTAEAASATVSQGGDIQAALDKVGDAGGGTVYLKSGSYTISATLKIPNNTTLKGQGSTRPIITLKSGLNVEVIQNKSQPYNNIKVDYLEINGGLSKAEMDNNSRYNVLGVDFSDQHSGLFSTKASVVNSYIYNCAMAIVMGRVTGCTITDTNITNCGSAATVGFHNIYLSIVDEVYVDNINSSNCRTGMGLKLTDYYAAQKEKSIVVKNSTFNNNYDRGMTIYDMENITVYNNTCNGNKKSGINLIRCEDGSVIYNKALNNGYVIDVAYDIWFNSCSGLTQNNNTYKTSKGL